MTGMSSREQDFLARCADAESDARMVAGLLFRASWERMVLLASTMEYRDACGVPLPSPDRDHDILTLGAMLSCVIAHTDGDAE
jgi:hypothetical protein